jgi:hypothetical protein
VLSVRIEYQFHVDNETDPILCQRENNETDEKVFIRIHFQYEERTFLKGKMNLIVGLLARRVLHSPLNAALDGVLLNAKSRMHVTFRSENCIL